MESGRLQCECVSVLCIGVYRPVYPLLTTLFYLDPPSVMYTYQDDNDVFKKNLFLSFKDIKKHKSLYRNDDNTKKRKVKKKVNVRIKG